VIEDVVVSSALASSVIQAFDVGVSASRTRRRFTTAYKLKILAAVARCTKPGEVGALLRREGLYSSHLTAWRAAQARGELRGPARPRGPVPRRPDPSLTRIAELERQVAKVTARAERAEALVAVQKKVAALWDQLAVPHDDAPTGRR
jgi:transposase-like protein